MHGVGTRLGRAAAGWLLVAGIVSVAVHPEGCRRPDDDELTAGARLAVEWFGNNLRPDGRFVRSPRFIIAPTPYVAAEDSKHLLHPGQPTDPCCSWATW